MALIYGPSALAFCKSDAEILVAGIGPYIRIYRKEDILSEFLIFPANMRITGLFFHNELFIVYAEDIMKIIAFKDNFLSIEIISSIQFIDWIVTARVESDNKITSVLHHGQIVYSTFDKIENLIRPSLWKIVVSAKIIDQGIVIGDSFGTISLFNPETGKYFEANHDRGSVFDIDIKGENIVASYEFHTVALWKLHDDSFELISSSSPHPSRVLGAKFIGEIPVSLGEDGYMKFHDGSNSSYHLHRVKLITSFCVNDNLEIATAGFDSVIRRFYLPIQSIPSTFKRNDKSEQVVNACILGDESFIIATNGGDAIKMPDNEILAHSNGAFFILGSNGKLAAGASRAYDVFIYDGEKCFTSQLPRQKAPSTIAVSKFGVFVVLNDITLVVYSLTGEIILDTPLTEYFKRPPNVAAASNDIQSLVICAHSTRITTFDFSSDMKNIEIATRIDTTSSGFSGATYADGCYYCVGRTDGVVTILAKQEKNWVIKSLYQLPGGGKSSLGVSSLKDKIVCAALSKTGVSFYDIVNQMELGALDFGGKHLRTTFSTTFDDGIFAVYWESDCLYSSKVAIVCGTTTSPSFHGLRGLFAQRCGDNMLLSGSCDRDIRVWSFIDNKIALEDVVQSVDSGTHAIATDGKTVYTGGSQQLLFEWELSNKKLFSKRSFDLTPLTAGGLCKRRVTTLCMNDEFVFVALSDATLYKLSRNDFSLIEKFDTPGVAMSSDYLDGVLSCATSKGSIWFNGNSQTIAKCGIHCMKLANFVEKLIVVTSCDDGIVRIHSIGENALTLMTEIGPNHTGGVKSIDVKIDDKGLNIVSFSYDQAAYLHFIGSDFSVIREKKFDSCISHGESVSFLDRGFAVYGTGIQYFEL